MVARPSTRRDGKLTEKSIHVAPDRRIRDDNIVSRRSERDFRLSIGAFRISVSRTTQGSTLCCISTTCKTNLTSKNDMKTFFFVQIYLGILYTRVFAIIYILHEACEIFFFSKLLRYNSLTNTDIHATCNISRP